MWPWEAFNWGVFWAVVAAGIVLAVLLLLGSFLGRLLMDIREDATVAHNKREMERIRQMQRH